MSSLDSKTSTHVSKCKHTRQSRTRTLIQIGGLVQKSGLLKAFEIELGMDLQSSEMRDHAFQLLKFLESSLKRGSKK